MGDRLFCPLSLCAIHFPLEPNKAIPLAVLSPHPCFVLIVATVNTLRVRINPQHENCQQCYDVALTSIELLSRSKSLCPGDGSNFDCFIPFLRHDFLFIGHVLFCSPMLPIYLDPRSRSAQRHQSKINHMATDSAPGKQVINNHGLAQAGTTMTT